MDDRDGLRELLQSATVGGRLPHSQSVTSLERSNERSLSPSSSFPLQSSLLATLLPSSLETVLPPSIMKRPSNAKKSSEGPLAELLRPAQLQQQQQQQSKQKPAVVQSLQELHSDSVQCETTSISQVKHASQRVALQGSLISATRHCIAYVLSDRKIRLIAQENAATGLMESHDPARIPIVDIAWSLQDLVSEAGTGLASHPSQQLLASLSQGGELCIGSVYAESSSALAYDALSATTFPELQPARGLAWSGHVEHPLLAVFGSGPEVFLLSVQATVSTAALITEIPSIQTVKFDSTGSHLYIAGLDKIVIFAIRSIEDVFNAQTVPLPSGVQRIWLINHTEGAVAIASLDEDQFLILPLFGNYSEMLVAIPLPGTANDLFTCFDQLTSVLCIGAVDSTRLVCVNLKSLSSPVISAGLWPNEQGSVSVFATSQLHSIFSKPPGCHDTDSFLYAYHRDSVKMHRLGVNWESTTFALEPEHLPNPSQEILRPSRNSSMSTPPLGAFVCTPNRNPPLPAALFSSSHSSALPDPLPPSSSSFPPTAELVKEIVSAVAKQIADQSKQLRRDRRDGEIAEQRRQQELLATTVNSIQQSVVANLHTAVKHEAGHIIESKLPLTLDAVADRLEQQIGQRVDALLAKSFGKSEKLSQMIAAQLYPALSQTLDKTVVESVESKLLPGLQALMTDLIGQLSANITQAIVDSTIEQYKQMMLEMASLRQSVVELQHRAFLLPTAQEVAQTVSEEIRHSLSPVASRSASYHLVPTADPKAAIRGEIEGMLKDRKLAPALIKVLEQGNIALLNWAIAQIDAAAALDEKDVTPAVILSLAQQLGCELSSSTDLKLAWLAEIFTVFDPRAGGDPAVATAVQSVLDEIFANLRVLFAETPASSTLHKQIKTVMRLVRMAMST